MLGIEFDSFIILLDFDGWELFRNNLLVFGDLIVYLWYIIMIMRRKEEIVIFKVGEIINWNWYWDMLGRLKKNVLFKCEIWNSFKDEGSNLFMIVYGWFVIWRRKFIW